MIHEDNRKQLVQDLTVNGMVLSPAIMNATGPGGWKYLDSCRRLLLTDQSYLSHNLQIARNFVTASALA